MLTLLIVLAFVVVLAGGWLLLKALRGKDDTANRTANPPVHKS